MKSRWPLVFPISLIAWALLSTPVLAESRPNILFILIDDMGYGDLSCYGNREVQTPNIDGLAKEGIRFTQFYVNAPICSPSRIAFTTGQYPNRWRITSYLDKRAMNRERGIADWLDPAAPSLARILAKAGYYTAHVGKWHMGGQRDVGDAPPITEYGFATSLTNFEGLGERVLPIFAPGKNGRPLRHEPTEMSAALGGGPIHRVERDKVTVAFVDRALSEMKQAISQHRPFYINLWPDDVHSPVQAPRELRGNGSPRANYLGVLSELDRQLGRVFDFIRTQPELRRNTIIILASDNGPEPGLGVTGGLRGSKGNLFEGGIREPLIVWGPPVASSAVGSSDDQSVIAAMDLAPTVLALTGVPISPDIHFDGIDCSNAWRGKPQDHRPSPIMWSRPPDRPGPDHKWPDLAIRDEHFKLLWWDASKRAELFDLRTDAPEKVDISKEHASETQRLKSQLLRWRDEVKPAS